MKKLIYILAGIIILASTAGAQDNGEFKVRDQTTKSEKEEKEKSEEKAFKKGSIVITVGFGYPNLYKPLYKAFISTINNLNSIYSYYNETTSYSVKGFGPAFFKAEYGLSKLIGLGVTSGYFNTTVTETVNYQTQEYNSSTSSYYYVDHVDVNKYYHSSLSFAARINFHFGSGEKLDPYVGTGVGYTMNQNTLTTTSDNPNPNIYQPYSRGSSVHFAITVGMRYYFIPNLGIYGEVGFDKWSLMQGGLVGKF